MKPSPIHEDNESCISWATNDQNGNKHFDVSYQICWKAVANNDLKLDYCPITEIAADLLTKQLEQQKITMLRYFLPIDSPLRDQK